ncbi:MAG: ATP-binding protein [Micavibrio sp.]
MFFMRKHHDCHFLMEALSEPAFIFDENGEFLLCNNPAKEILAILKYDNGRMPENLSVFKEGLRIASSMDGRFGLSVGGDCYVLSHGVYDDKFLIRLMPIRESGHFMRLSKALDVLPWGIVTIDTSGRNPSVLFCNPKAGDLTGMPHEVMIGMNLARVLSFLGIEGRLAARAYEEAVSKSDFEIIRDGRPRYCRLHFIPQNSPAPFCLMVIEDRTEERLFENRRSQAQRLESLGQLAGGVAHDFNNILSIIDGYARMTRKTLDDREKAGDYIRKIAQSVQRGSALTEKLLAFGCSRADRQCVFDLGELVREQEVLVAPLFDESITLGWNIADGLYVEGVPDNICQIVLNLCVNARDAMTAGGALEISVYRNESGMACLAVADNGCGMSEEVKGRIFDPFFTTKDVGKGSGLGLFMVYGLVKDMNGVMDVISHAGAGTAVTVSFPVCADEPSRIQGENLDAGECYSLHGVTAMIAEDEPDLLNLVGSMLEEMGAQVIKAKSGEEALALQEKFDGDIDFLLTDIVMPGVNGVRLAELFHLVRPASGVLFMSGYAEEGYMAKIPLPDNALFIPKPVSARKLEDMLRGVFHARNNNIHPSLKAERALV